MAQNKYLSSERSALFSIENDVDDDEFLRKRQDTRPADNNLGYNSYSDRTGNIPSYNSKPYSNYGNQHDNFEERRLQFLERKREIEERTAESTERSLNLLRNSEEVGIATAEELLKQREQLERTDKRLDDINATLRYSHKHIQGIKSVFGSLKNYLSGKADTAPLPSQYTKDTTPEINAHVRPLSQTVAVSSASAASASSSSGNGSDHPGLRIRGLGDSEELSVRPKTCNSQQVIDKNIDEIMGSISRLKGLAQNLGEEIESQNDLLDNILPKVDKSDITIQRQNKDIKRLLK